MRTEDKTEKLEALILLLETKKSYQEELLKAQFKSIQPINLIKSTFEELVNEPCFKEDMLDSTLSMVAGYFSKKIIFGASTNHPIKQAFGNLLQMGVTSFVSKYSEGLRHLVTNFINDIFPKKDKDETDKAK